MPTYHIMWLETSKVCDQTANLALSRFEGWYFIKASGMCFLPLTAVFKKKKLSGEKQTNPV